MSTHFTQPTTFYCESCREWTRVAAFETKDEAEQPACSACYEPYCCGECGYEIDGWGNCLRAQNTGDTTCDDATAAREAARTERDDLAPCGNEHVPHDDDDEPGESTTKEDLRNIAAGTITDVVLVDTGGGSPDDQFWFLGGRLDDVTNGETPERDEDPTLGHCDTCGALCDADGCTADRTHVAALTAEEAADRAALVAEVEASFWFGEGYSVGRYETPTPRITELAPEQLHDYTRGLLLGAAHAVADQAAVLASDVVGAARDLTMSYPERRAMERAIVRRTIAIRREPPPPEPVRASRDGRDGGGESNVCVINDDGELQCPYCGNTVFRYEESEVVWRAFDRQDVAAKALHLVWEMGNHGDGNDDPGLLCEAYDDASVEEPCGRPVTLPEGWEIAWD